MSQNLWVEKYRPGTLADYIFHDEAQKKKIYNLIHSGDIPHLLFTGVQGTGKTSLSNVIINELDVNKNDVLRINASDETGVDTMRDKIKTFAMTYPFGKFKVVQLEEMDYLSPNAQATLRSMMEEYSENCKFIGTANLDNKIIPALKSRMQHFHFKKPSQEDIFIKMAEILLTEEIEFDEELLNKYIASAYPDIRKIINLLQQNSIGNILQEPKDVQDKDYHFEMIDLLKSGDWVSTRKLVCSQIAKEEIEDMYTWLYENREIYCKPEQEHQVIITIANHLYRHALSANTEITLASCFAQLGSLLSDD